MLLGSLTAGSQNPGSSLSRWALWPLEFRCLLDKACLPLGQKEQARTLALKWFFLLEKPQKLMCPPPTCFLLPFAQATSLVGEPSAGADLQVPGVLLAETPPWLQGCPVGNLTPCARVCHLDVWPAGGDASHLDVVPKPEVVSGSLEDVTT